jgi:hypothetical protein
MIDVYTGDGDVVKMTSSCGKKANPNSCEWVKKSDIEGLLEFVGKIAQCDGSMIEGNAAARKARELLGIESSGW